MHVSVGNFILRLQIGFNYLIHVNIHRVKMEHVIQLLYIARCIFIFAE